MEGFYQLNNKVLEFKIDKDPEKILFNHYIMQHENFQRLKKELPRGQFYITLNNMVIDLGITKKKARVLIRQFIKLGIITNIFTPETGSRKPSIFQYNAVILNEENDIKKGTDKGTDEGTDKPYNINGFKGMKGTDGGTDRGTSKKELLKAINKNLYIEQLWTLYPNKKGKAAAIKKIPALIKRYEYGQMERTIQRYIKDIEERRKTFPELNYKNGSTYFNEGYVDYLDENYKDIEEAKAEVYKRQKEFNDLIQI